MSSKSEIQKNSAISIVGAVLFAALTVLAPLLKILGGFLKYSESVEVLGTTYKITIDYFWDKVTGSVLGLSMDFSYNQYVEQENSSVGFIWQIIPLWGLFWILLGLIGAVLVIIPPLMKLTNQEPIELPLAMIGLAAGLIGTVIEFSLFLLVWLLDTGWDTKPDINIILLGAFVIGWISLVVGYYFSMKDSTP